MIITTPLTQFHWKGVDFMENRFEWHGTPPDLPPDGKKGAPAKGQQAKVAG